MQLIRRCEFITILSGQGQGISSDFLIDQIESVMSFNRRIEGYANWSKKFSRKRSQLASVLKIQTNTLLRRVLN